MRWLISVLPPFTGIFRTWNSSVKRLSDCQKSEALMSQETVHERYMARALQLAEQGLYTTDPNPRVGCVLVREDRIIAEGWHRKAGGPHAEADALTEAGPEAEGATAYVTLEPCCHTGRTSPCCDRLIEAGVKRVVCAMEDPNPLVSGSGFENLKRAGIIVESGILEEQARALNPGFIKRMEKGIPLVRCKLAMSLDGRTAMASGESQWITGSAARSDVQRLRARSSAIVTGVETVLLDDPSFTLREQELGLANASEVVAHAPLRVVLDSRFRIPGTAKMLAQPGPVLVIGTTDGAAREGVAALGADTLVFEGAGQPDLKRVLQVLADRECNEVLVEAGATLSGAFLRQGLLDELVVYVAPKLLGDDARGLFNLPGMARMSDQISLEIKEIRSVGQDFRVTATIVKQN